MIYDIPMLPRGLQQSYLSELPGQATQTSQSDQHMVIQRHDRPFQKRRPQHLQMKTCHKVMGQQRHRLHTSDINGKYKAITLSEYTTDLERLCPPRSM